MWDQILEIVNENEFFKGAALAGAITAILAYFRTVPLRIIRLIYGFISISKVYRKESGLFYKVASYVNLKFRDSKFGSFSCLNTDDFIPLGNRFMFKHRALIIFNLSERDLDNGSGGSSTEYTVSIRTIGPYRKSALKKIEGEIEKNWEDNNKEKSINMRSYDYWDKYCSLKKRDIKTLYSENLENIIADIEHFLLLETKKYYQKRGIPYRISFLLHGPPGTGKTSCALAIANYFNWDLNVINFSSISSDNHFIRAMASDSKLILIEDIDAFTNSTQSREDKDNKTDISIMEDQLTLGGILMGIDGPFTNEGHILIMTTNHIDKIDPALLRPGRVDKKIRMGEISKEKCVEMVENLFEMELSNDQIVQIYDLVDKYKYTPAEIQKRFLDAKGNISNFFIKENNEIN